MTTNLAVQDGDNLPADAGTRPVLAAICAVMGEVGSVEKRGNNEFHRYKYATAADIAHALQKRMAAHGLIIIPYQQKSELIAEATVLAVDYAFEVLHVSGDKLDERPIFTGMSAARNTKGGFDDKAANKCLTAANKYFVLNLFRIPTGDYADADGEEDKAPKRGNGKAAAQADTGEVISDAQLKTLRTAIDETEADVVAFCRWLGIDALPDMRAADYGRAMKALDQKRAMKPKLQVSA